MPELLRFSEAKEFSRKLNFRNMFLKFLMLNFLFLYSGMTQINFKQKQRKYPRVRTAYREKEVSIRKLLMKHNLSPENIHIYIRFGRPGIPHPICEAPALIGEEDPQAFPSGTLPPAFPSGEPPPTFPKHCTS